MGASTARWLAPDFWDPADGRVPLGDPDLAAAQRGPHDPGRHRRGQPQGPAVRAGLEPPGHRTSSTTSRAAGVRPEDVDIVVNTHLHIDHVGWNTRLDGRTWVPTFPNATYLMPQRDFDFWNPANDHEPLLGRGNQNVFEDSVAPVHEAGLAQLWDGRLPDRPEPAAGTRARPHARLVRADPGVRRRPCPVRRRPGAHPVADRGAGRPTPASARTRSRPAPPGTSCSAGRPRTTRWSSPLTSAATAPPRSSATARSSRSGMGGLLPHSREAPRPGKEELPVSQHASPSSKPPCGRRAWSARPVRRRCYRAIPYAAAPPAPAASPHLHRTPAGPASGTPRSPRRRRHSRSAPSAVST